MQHALFPWQSIDTIFLDMDGTLLDLHYDDHFWQDFLPNAYASHHNLTLEQANAELQPKFKATEGSLDWYCVDYWSRELGLDIPSLKKEVAHLIAIHDGVIDFLQAMKKMGKRIVLMTNAHRKVVELKLHHTGIDVHFDAIVSSHDLGLPKEDPEFWNKLQSIETYDKTRTLFADDTIAVLHSAKEAGLQHLLFIAKPSSQRAARTADGYIAINGFAELIDELKHY
jgi:putative hydrolase of the HAD superfamily